MGRSQWWLWAAVIAGAAVGAGVAGAAGATAGGEVPARELPNPGAQSALNLREDKVTLVTTPGAGDVCLATMSGRARGSACASAGATEILTSTTVSGSGFTLGIFDPRQQAAYVIVDGVKQDSVRSEAGALQYFSIVGTNLPSEIQVKDASGRELQSLFPAAEQARSQLADRSANNH